MALIDSVVDQRWGLIGQPLDDSNRALSALDLTIFQVANLLSAIEDAVCDKHSDPEEIVMSLAKAGLAMLAMAGPQINFLEEYLTSTGKIFFNVNAEMEDMRKRQEAAGA